MSWSFFFKKMGLVAPCWIYLKDCAKQKDIISVVKWNPVNRILFHYKCGWLFLSGSPSSSTTLVWGCHIQQEATSVFSVIHGKCKAHIYVAYTFLFLPPSCLLYFVTVYVEVNTEWIWLSNYFPNLLLNISAQIWQSLELPHLSLVDFLVSSKTRTLTSVFLFVAQTWLWAWGRQETHWFGGLRTFWRIEVHMLLQFKSMDLTKQVPEFVHLN